MSSETRVIRPYVGLDPVQAALDKLMLRIGPEQLLPGEQRTIAASSYLNDKAVVVLGSDDDEVADTATRLSDAVAQIGLNASDVEFVVTVSTPYLRMMDVPIRVGLNEFGNLPHLLRLATDEFRPAAFSTPSGGCDINVAITLGRDERAEPLRPSKKGTWLGRARFFLRTELGDIGFTPLPLTAEAREQFGLPPDSIRYVALDEDALLGEDLSSVELYVDVEILAQLNQASSSPVARALQRQLFVDVIAAIVREASRGTDLGELADLEGSVLDRVVGAAVGRGVPGESNDDIRKRRETAFMQLKNDPELFMSYVESKVSMRDDLVSALGGEE